MSLVNATQEKKIGRLHYFCPTTHLASLPAAKNAAHSAKVRQYFMSLLPDSREGGREGGPLGVRSSANRELKATSEAFPLNRLFDRSTSLD